MRARVIAAAAIAVLVVGGALYLHRPDHTAISGPGPAPTASASHSPPELTPAPQSSPTGLTGPLGDGRQIHTATSLADGRVLVAGGYAMGDASLASADLYDPHTDTFSPTASLASPRGLHTATLLADGHVLIAGGGPASWVRRGAYLASAELYDPRTETFSPTGSMTSTREGHTATLLRDGRVLIAGGDDMGDHAVASAELFDPRTGTFSSTGSMKTARWFHTATLLSDGRVLITGGDAYGWNWGTRPMVASAELYDPATGTFSATGSMTIGRAWHTATLLHDGRVLVTGGGSGPLADLTSAEIYDPRTGTFSPTGFMTFARVYHTATLLGDGRVLVIGGGKDYTNLLFLASAEIFDPKTGTFTTTGSMTDGRTFHAASLLADGRVLVTGGYGAVAPLASAEIYNPKTRLFSRAGSAAS